MDNDKVNKPTKPIKTETIYITNNSAGSNNDSTTTPITKS